MPQRVVLTVLFFCLFLSGCSQRELQERILIQAIGVDKSEEGYAVTVRAADPNEEGEELFTCRGASVLEALDGLSLSTGREPFYAHNYLVVFGQTCGEAGLEDVLDFFIRYYTTRPTVQMYLAQGTAEEILVGDGELPGIQELQRLSQAGDATGKAVSVDFLEFVNAAQREGSSPVLPVLTLEEGTPTLGGCSFFQNYKLQGTLSPEETRGYLAIQGRLNQGELVVSGEKFGTATLTVSQGNGKRTVAFGEDGYPIFRIQYQATLDISSLSGENSQLDDGFYSAIEQAVEKKLERDMKAALEKSVIQDRCDIFGFGNELYQQYPKRWKQFAEDWPHILEQCHYEIQVHATVLRMEQGGL